MWCTAIKHKPWPRQACLCRRVSMDFNLCDVLGHMHLFSGAFSQPCRVALQAESAPQYAVTTFETLKAEMDILRRVFMEADVKAASLYVPHWRAFSTPKLDFGKVRIGTELRQRIVLHNRGTSWTLLCSDQAWVEQTASMLPACSFSLVCALSCFSSPPFRPSPSTSPFALLPLSLEQTCQWVPHTLADAWTPFLATCRFWGCGPLPSFALIWCHVWKWFSSKTSELTSK